MTLCARFAHFFYYPVFEFYIYVNWERIESEVLCIYFCDRFCVVMSAAVIAIYPILILFTEASKLFYALLNRDHVQLSLAINCRWIIIFLSATIYQRIPSSTEARKKNERTYLATVLWLTIKCSSKNNQQICQRFAQFTCTCSHYLQHYQWHLTRQKAAIFIEWKINILFAITFHFVHIQFKFAKKI